MKKIDGIILPGGSINFSPFNTTFMEAVKFIYAKTIELNDNGHPFLLWGTCQGFELLLCVTQNDPNTITKGFNSIDVDFSLIFTSEGKKSKLYSMVPENLRVELSTQNLTYNDHHWGIHPVRFYSFPLLTDFYNILTTSYDLNHVEFVSSIEAKNYPIYGVQFHPEAALALFCENAHYPHQDSSKLFTYYLSQFINSHPRNSHDFQIDDLLELEGKWLSWEGHIKCMYGYYYFDI
eukprot:Anaeramoba_ignava/a347936_32.p1 GENE.a347936_32~~a347936_32.p1  ORF type:complete len:235 (-),score=44.63 a347936_32:133-837(-)